MEMNTNRYAVNLTLVEMVVQLLQRTYDGLAKLSSVGSLLAVKKPYI